MLVTVFFGFRPSLTNTHKHIKHIYFHVYNSRTSMSLCLTLNQDARYECIVVCLLNGSTSGWIIIKYVLNSSCPWLRVSVTWIAPRNIVYLWSLYLISMMIVVSAFEWLSEKETWTNIKRIQDTKHYYLLAEETHYFSTMWCFLDVSLILLLVFTFQPLVLNLSFQIRILIKLLMFHSL